MAATQPGHAIGCRPQRLYACLRQIARTCTCTLKVKMILDAGRAAISHIAQRIARQHHRLDSGQQPLIDEP